MKVVSNQRVSKSVLALNILTFINESFTTALLTVALLKMNYKITPVWVNILINVIANIDLRTKSELRQISQVSHGTDLNC